MTRRTVIALVVSMTTCLALAGAAEAKPKVAILGIEVISASGQADPVTTNTAQLFTEGLRAEAAKRTGPYSLAPNSKKDLLEMKLLSNCSTEALGCMSEIGRELNADFMMYGKMEAREGEGYHVTLKLLDTRKREMVTTSEIAVPFRDREPDRIGTYVSRLYKKMVGLPMEGSLVVRLRNADKGTVYVDGEIRGSVSGGTAKILGLTEGARTLEVEATGFERYSRQVQITANEELGIEIELERSGGGGGDGEPGELSRTLFWVTAGLTVASGGGWAVEGIRVVTTLEDDKEDAMEAYRMNFDDGANVASCGAAKNALDGTSGAERDALSEVVDACNTGKLHANITTALIATTITGAALATFFFYKGYIEADDEYEERPGVAERDRDEEPETSIRVLPHLGPDSVGAGVTVEF